MLTDRKRIVARALSTSEREPEEYHLVGATHPALVLVDREPKLLGQVPRETVLNAFTGAGASQEDQEVVGVARESMAAAFQLHVEVVQQDVGEQGRERVPLGGAHLRWLDDVPDQDAGTQVAGDEGEQLLVPLMPMPGVHKRLDSGAARPRTVAPLRGAPAAQPQRWAA